MLLSLYQVEDGTNVINKTLEDALNIQITVRNDFDIINPQLKLSKIDGVDFKNYNYCHIPELSRFYFIDSISSITGELYTLECRCDVLETYKNEILNSVCRYKRNLRIGDYQETDLELSLNSHIEMIESDKGFEGEKSMILTTAGV